METKNWTATVTTAYGNPVEPALKISGTYKKYDTVEEVQQAYSKPGEFNKFVCDSATAADKASTIAQARTEALKAAGIEAPKMENSRDLQIKSIVRGLVAAGRTEAEALQIAEGLVPPSAAKDNDESESAA